MRSVILALGVAMILGACATSPSAYGPAETGKGLGFENTKIENDRFRVSYTGRSVNEARDYALRRAAEITLQEGYTHFQVLGGFTQGNGAPSGVSTSVGFGVGGGRGYRRGGTNVGIGIGLNDVGRALQGQRITESIEIMLTNIDDGNPNVYDAQSVTVSIRPTTFQ